MANKRVITSDMFSDDKFMFFDDFTRILWVGLITVTRWHAQKSRNSGRKALQV